MKINAFDVDYVLDDGCRHEELQVFVTVKQ